MTPIPRLSAYTADVDRQQKATARLAFAVSSDSYFAENFLSDFKRRGFSRFVKTNVDYVSGADPGVAIGTLDAAFVGMVEARSVLGPLLELGAVAFPLNGAARLQVGEVLGAEVPEGAAKPVTRIDFELAGLPKKTVAQIVVSSEAMLAIDQATQTGIRDVLVAAVARATDRVVVNALTANAPISNATVADLFAAISGGAPAAPVLLGGLDTLLALPPGHVSDFEAMGIATIATPAASGKLIAVDATGVLIGDGGLELATARDANLVMDDGAAPPSSTVVSLWQQNLTALRAERFLRVAVRAGASAWTTTGARA
jgi:hypothetical protein